VGEAVHEAGQAERDQRRAGDVVTGVALGPALADQAQPERAGDQRDRDVHQQTPAPVRVLGEHAAQQQADRGATAGDRPVHAEGLGPLLGVGEQYRQQGERGRREERPESALQRAGGEQRHPVVGQAAQAGGEGEADNAEQERALAAPVVGDPAPEQEQTPESQRVRRDDPLPVRVGDAERVLGLGQRDVHDGGVEDDHELRDRDDGERLPASRIRCRGTGRLDPFDDTRDAHGPAPRHDRSRRGTVSDGRGYARNPAPPNGLWPD
jgi:hypothetical protein